MSVIYRESLITFSTSFRMVCMSLCEKKTPLLRSGCTDTPVRCSMRSSNTESILELPKRSKEEKKIKMMQRRGGYIRELTDKFFVVYSLFVL